MILSDSQILKELELGTIVIEPFDIKCLGSNSYDVHLGKYLGVYKDFELDARKHNKMDFIQIPEDGYVLRPDILYLGSTQEYNETHKHVPFLEGKSSIGRLGICIHLTAGKGDVGYCNTWTMELSVVQPVRVYAGMPIGQLIFFDVLGDVLTLYKDKTGAKYVIRNEKPVESMMWKNFP